MPQVHTYTYDLLQLAFPGQHVNLPQISVKLKPSTVFPKGCLLGELTASPGVYAPYDAAANDGSQNAKLILERACATDASSNITFGSAATGGEWGETKKSAPAFYDGVFRTADLPQAGAGSIDATSVDITSAKHIGFLIQGTTAAGLIKLK